MAALIDADEAASGFRSRLASKDVLEMSARTDLARDSWLFEQGGRVVAAGGGELHAGAYFARGCVHPDAKGRGLGPALPCVDSANASGATRLYESVGMRPEADHTTFAKAL